MLKSCFPELILKYLQYHLASPFSRLATSLGEADKGYCSPAHRGGRGGEEERKKSKGYGDLWGAYEKT